ncbi:MAG: hypothetical protein A3K06_03690 [Candidatus Doudnabacteria bacterium RIFCSPHIGHO2_01_52_17]|uniref:Four helix bundle protein n=1 Tax=Candidatus Doudnabacteria bacterium RIFCSPHIGHO2_01_52_17 TaxID=1817820 RepID=A0A1F5N9H8_9BACT|nr:MAG: hypothetical protein A3K06_03690 [Candidatus Doudnabacteria bacterium RIFCSPHIGHO2_01_52_17]
MGIESYKDLIVWKKSVDLVVATYELTDKLPKSELYGLTAQMKEASVSIPANIAEGRRRGTRKDFRHFLLNAFGSGAELESHIEICKRLPFGKNLDYEKVDRLLDEVMRMLNKMSSNLLATS